MLLRGFMLRLLTGLLQLLQLAWMLGRGFVFQIVDILVMSYSFGLPVALGEDAGSVGLVFSFV